MNKYVGLFQHGLPAPVRIGAQLFAAALAAFFWLTFSGPYRWLAELQMKWFDGYHPLLTWVLTTVSLLLPLNGTLQLARKLGVLGEPSADAAQADGVLTEQRFSSFEAFIQRHVIPIALAGGALVALFPAAHNWLIARDGAELEPLKVAALEAGTAPRGNHVEVQDGAAAWDAAIEWREGERRSYYVPLLSEGWQAGKPVSVMLLLDEDEVENLPRNTATFRGARMAQSPPTPVQVAFREAGFETSQALVLVVGVDPSGSADALELLVALAGGLLVTAGGVFVWQRRRDRSR